MPQKQPPAKTAASRAVERASGASIAGTGIVAEGAAGGRALSERKAVQPTSSRMLAVAMVRPMMGLCMEEFLTAVRVCAVRKVTPVDGTSRLLYAKGLKCY